MAKKGSVGKTILKIIFGIIITIGVIFIGLYCYLKFALGIDIFDIKNKLSLLNKPVNQSTLITQSFTEDDGLNVIESMYGENNIYSRNGDEIVFNFDVFVASDILEQQTLTDEQLASLFSVFFENVDYTKLGLQENYSQFLSVKQIKFSNLTTSADSTSVDINYVIKLDIEDLQEELMSESGIIAFIIDTFLPDNLFISSTFNISIPKDAYENYVITDKSFLINNLSQQQTNEVLELVNLISKEDLKSTLPSNVNTMLCDLLFGGQGSAGLISSIKDIGGIEFCQTADGIAIVIKKV